MDIRRLVLALSVSVLTGCLSAPANWILLQDRHTPDDEVRLVIAPDSPLPPALRAEQADDLATLYCQDHGYASAEQVGEEEAVFMLGADVIARYYRCAGRSG